MAIPYDQSSPVDVTKLAAALGATAVSFTFHEGKDGGPRRAQFSFMVNGDQYADRIEMADGESEDSARVTLAILMHETLLGLVGIGAIKAAPQAAAKSPN